MLPASSAYCCHAVAGTTCACMYPDAQLDIYSERHFFPGVCPGEPHKYVPEALCLRKLLFLQTGHRRSFKHAWQAGRLAPCYVPFCLQWLKEAATLLRSSCSYHHKPQTSTCKHDSTWVWQLALNCSGLKQYCGTITEGDCTPANKVCAGFSDASSKSNMGSVEKNAKTSSQEKFSTSRQDSSP
jgi:hypothetical protein